VAPVQQMGQEICGSRYEGIAYVTDLPSATAIEETVISNTGKKTRIAGKGRGICYHSGYGPLHWIRRIQKMGRLCLDPTSHLS
jgi:hypothetical protein